MPIGDGRSRPRSGRFFPRGRTSVSILQEVGWASGLVWTGAKISPPLPTLGFKPQTTQNVVSRYADYAMLAARVYVNIMYYTGRSFRSGNVCRGADDIFPLATDDSACCLVVSPPLPTLKKDLYKFLSEKEVYCAPSLSTYVSHECSFELSIHL